MEALAKQSIEICHSKRRSLFKTLTWRMLGTIDTMVISYFFTGSLKLAAAIGSFEVVSKMILYYFHERAWEKVSWGKF